jgi:hypothetical protein
MDPMYDLHYWSKQRCEEALTGQAGKRRTQDPFQTRWSRLRLEWRPRPVQVAVLGA